MSEPVNTGPGPTSGLDESVNTDQPTTEPSFNIVERTFSDPLLAEFIIHSRRWGKTLAAHEHTCPRSSDLARPSTPCWCYDGGASYRARFPNLDEDAATRAGIQYDLRTCQLAEYARSLADQRDAPQGPDEAPLPASAMSGPPKP